MKCVNIGAGGKGGTKSRQTSRGGKWYDLECRNQKDKFNYKKDVYLRTGEEMDRIHMCVERNIYRKMCRSKKREFNRNEAQRLVELGRTNPKLFWKDIKKKSGKNNANELPDCDFLAILVN